MTANRREVDEFFDRPAVRSAVWLAALGWFGGGTVVALALIKVLR